MKPKFLESLSLIELRDYIFKLRVASVSPRYLKRPLEELQRRQGEAKKEQRTANDANRAQAAR